MIKIERLRAKSDARWRQQSAVTWPRESRRSADTKRLPSGSIVQGAW
jgi:hypothetical protein